MRRAGVLIGIEYVLANMAFEDFNDETGHRATRGGYQLQQVGAILPLVDGAFDGLNLAPYAANSPYQFVFVI